MNPLVIAIPGAKLLSSRGSGANCSDNRMVRAKDKKRHRDGANAMTAKAIASAIPGYRVLSLFQGGRPYWIVAIGYDIGRFPARRVTFTRICPKRHFCDPGGNLATLFKATEDGVADALGVNDKNFVPVAPGQPVPDGRVGVWYEQVDGPWGIRITIET